MIEVRAVDFKFGNTENYLSRGLRLGGFLCHAEPFDDAQDRLREACSLFIIRRLAEGKNYRER